MSLVISPKTGELIKVGSDEFSELLDDPKYSKTINSPNSSLRDVKMPQLPPLKQKSNPKIEPARVPIKDKHLKDILNMSLYDIPTLEETLKATSQPSKREKLKQMIREKKVEEGRGIKTRGWASRSPTRGRERHQVKAECGDKCFLLPDEEKFPICPSPRLNNGNSICKIDCAGVQAAKIRAAQWGYKDVEEKADAILEKCDNVENFTPEELPEFKPSLKMAGKTGYSAEITRLLKDPPRSWRTMFRKEGLDETPSISEVLTLLDKTAGGNKSFEAEKSPENPKKYVPPESVRKEAMKGIRLSHEHNYPSYKGIGLARAIQLATEPAIYRTSIDRMNAFFKRNARYKQMKGFNDDENPSKSYLAYLNWGGQPAENWLEKI